MNSEHGSTAIRRADNRDSVLEVEFRIRDSRWSHLGFEGYAPGDRNFRERNRLRMATTSAELATGRNREH